MKEDFYNIKYKPEKLVYMKQNDCKEILGIKIETIPAYNTNKEFHKKDYGYIININNTRIYIAGDTDITEENKRVKCDIALVLIGGGIYYGCR